MVFLSVFLLHTIKNMYISLLQLHRDLILRIFCFRNRIITNYIRKKLTQNCVTKMHLKNLIHWIWCWLTSCFLIHKILVPCAFTFFFKTGFGFHKFIALYFTLFWFKNFDHVWWHVFQRSFLGIGTTTHVDDKYITHWFYFGDSTKKCK